MAFTLIRPGVASSVQDLGRCGYQKYGIIVGGVMDPPSARLANWLVGNPDDAALIEFSFLGPSILFEDQTLFALTGGHCRPKLDGISITPGRPLLARAGQILTIGGLTAGCRGYFAVAGGIDVPEWFGSRSTYIRAGVGGYGGRMLQPHDRIPVGRPVPLVQKLMVCLPDTEDGWFFSLRRSYRGAKTIRVIADGFWDRFTEESRRTFQEAEYTVTTASDRMGYRLDGPELHLEKPLEMYSEAVTNGSIQVPRGGHPIILMTDHQSTGGYPRIAQVASADLPILAQLPPQSRLRFRLISISEAERLLVAQEKRLMHLRLSVVRKLEKLASDTFDLNKKD